ncbi:MAG: phosphate ABC transporter permease subunit PstC [Acidobacteriota bacterium]
MEKKVMKRAKEVFLFRRKLVEFFIEKGIAVVSMTAIFAIILIFVFTFKETIPLLYDREARKEVSLENLFINKIWQPVSEKPKYSMLPLLTGTFKISLIALIVSSPIAILAAIFTSQFARGFYREAIKPFIEILAGLPSVVIGFFALTALASLVQDLTGSTYRLNAFVGGVGVSFAMIPIIFTIAEDAINSVPRAMKDASLALGARPYQTILRVILPAAFPGIAASILLGFGRAVGETMICLMATGNAAIISLNPFDSTRTLSATIGAEMAEVVFGGPHYRVLFLIGSILFIITFGLNFLSSFYIARLSKKLKGK